MQRTAATTTNNQLIQESNYNYAVPIINPNNNTIDYITKSDYFAQRGQTSAIFKIETQWNQSVIPLQKDRQSKHTKMIIWNNKPYIIIISPDPKEFNSEIEITMVDPENTNIIHQNRYYFCREEHWCIRSISWSINHATSELYITIIYNALTACEYQPIFLIYDLNAGKLQKRCLLNFKMNNGENFNDHTKSIGNISIINNNNCKTANTTSFHIINNWSRRNFHTATVIPKDIYVLIDQFYSFCVKQNTLQLIIFGCREYSVCGDEFSEWYLHHAIIDVDSARNNNNYNSVIDVELINSKQIHPKKVVISYKQRHQILSIRIDYELYIMFGHATWIISLETGTMRQESKLLPYRENDYMRYYILDDIYFMAYDSISCIDSVYDNENDRYLFFLMEDRNKSIRGSKAFNLWYFDKINKAFFKDHTDNYTKICFPGLNFDNSYSNLFKDMVFYGNELIVCETGYEDNIWISRTTLTS